MPLRTGAVSHPRRSGPTRRVQLLDLREDFELLSGADALTTYRFNTGTAEHIFCKFCGIHSYGVPRVRPDRITVNARCLDNVERAVLTPNRFFDGQNWEEAAKRYLATEQGRAR